MRGDETKVREIGLVPVGPEYGDVHKYKMDTLTICY